MKSAQTLHPANSPSLHSSTMSLLLVILLFCALLLPENAQAKKKTSEIIIMGLGGGRPQIYKSDDGKHKEIYIIGRRKRSVREGEFTAQQKQQQHLSSIVFLLPPRR